MKMTRGFRFRLEPTEHQHHQLNYLAGGCRYIFNLCLEQRMRCRDEVLPTLLDLHNRREDMAQLTKEEFLKEVKKEKAKLEKQQEEGLPILHKIKASAQSAQFTVLRGHVEFLSNLPFSPLQNTITQDVDRAFQNFFRRVKQGLRIAGATKNQMGFPRKRTRGKLTIPFKPSDVRLMRESRKINMESGDYFSQIRIPKMDSWIKMRQDRPFPKDAKIGSSRITKEPDGHWYISFVVSEEVDDPIAADNPKTIAIVRGTYPIYYHTSNNETFPSDPRHLKLLENLKKVDTRIAKLERKRNRQKPHSNNWRRTKFLIFKAMNKKTKAMDTMRHQITSYLVDRYDRVIIEDYKIAEKVILKNRKRGHHARKSIDHTKEIAWHSFKLHLGYKLEWLGGRLETLKEDVYRRNCCSHCGSTKIHTRVGIVNCESCDVEMEAPYNQAMNLLKDYQKTNESFETTDELVNEIMAG